MEEVSQLPAAGKKYKIVVADTVWVKVQTKIAGEKGDETHNFFLLCKRIGAEEQKSLLQRVENDMAQFLVEVVQGWKDQRLVIDPDTNAPAEFCPDALAALLDIGGMANVCFVAYLKEASAKAKN